MSNLSSEVKELMAQRDAELLAAQKAAEEAARQEEERRKAAAAAANKNNGSSGGSSSGGSSSGGSQTITGNGSLAAVRSAAYSVPSPGSGLCAAWVTRVFAAAGLNVGGGNACDMYNWYCYTSVSNIQPGMIVACPSAPYSSAAMIYGHVGIYLGNNTVRDNASGRLRTSSLSAWVSEYSCHVHRALPAGWAAWRSRSPSKRYARLGRPGPLLVARARLPQRACLISPAACTRPLDHLRW